MLLEFVIRHEDGDFFALPYAEYLRVLHPNSVAYKVVGEPSPGIQTIWVAGCKVEMVDEMPGLAVAFSGMSIPHALAVQVMNEIRENIDAATGQRHVVLEMPTDRPYRFA